MLLWKYPDARYSAVRKRTSFSFQITGWKYTWKPFLYRSFNARISSSLKIPCL